MSRKAKQPILNEEFLRQSLITTLSCEYDAYKEAFTRYLKSTFFSLHDGSFCVPENTTLLDTARDHLNNVESCKLRLNCLNEHGVEVYSKVYGG